MKIAVIGVGAMGSQYAQMIGQGLVGGLELAAVTRVKGYFKAKLQPMLDAGLPVYESADALFEAVEAGKLHLDAVVIATPHYSHETIAERAFSDGLHVMCDKPAGVYSAQARRMSAKAFASNRIFAMMFHQRTMPVYKRLRELVQSGKYGQLKRVSWTVTDWYRTEKYYKLSPWRATWTGEGGGLLINQCPHNLDLLCWICGLPAKVQGICHEGRFHEIEVEDDVTAYLEWPNGATGSFISSTGDALGENRLVISMDEAILICEDHKLTIRELGDELGMPEAKFRKKTDNAFCRIQGQTREENFEAEPTPYLQMLANFARACESGESLIAAGEEGWNSLLLSNAIHLSSWEKRMVEIPTGESMEMQQFEQAFEAGLKAKIEKQ